MASLGAGCAHCDHGFISIIERRRLQGALIETVATTRCDCPDGQTISKKIPDFAVVLMSQRYQRKANRDDHGWWFVPEEKSA